MDKTVYVEKQYNSVAFTPKDVDKGLHLKFIDNLIKFNRETEETYYNDIHICYDGYCTIVEWCCDTVDTQLGNGKFLHIANDKLDEVYDILENKE